MDSPTRTLLRHGYNSRKTNMASLIEDSGTVLSDLEIQQITEAMKDDKFRKLLHEYTEEIGNPENLRRYEAELCLLEKERGIDAKFIYPEEGYVLKTINESQEPVFVNIAKNASVDKPSCSRSEIDEKGLNWSVPYLLAPPKRDKDQNGQKCYVYDVVFHTDTLYMASKNDKFRKMIEETALDGVEERFSVNLNREKISYPKFSFKGSVTPTIMRKCSISSGSSSPVDDMETFLCDKIKNACTIDVPATAITPEYTIKYQQSVSLSDYDIIASRSANLRPTAVIVDVYLPLFESADQLILDVSNQMLSLTSLKPGPLIELKLKLTFPVDETSGNAHFDKTARHLIVTLPIVPYRAAENEVPDFTLPSDAVEMHRCEYGLPDFTVEKPLFRFHQDDENIVLIVDVPNVAEESVTVEYCECSASLKLEFNSNVCDRNALCILFDPDNEIVPSVSTFDASDANVVLRLVKSNPGTWSGFKSSGSGGLEWAENKFVTRESVLEKLKNLKEETESSLNNSRSVENGEIDVKTVSEDIVTLRVQVGIPASSKLEAPKNLENETSIQSNDYELPKPRNDSESSDENARPYKRGILKYPRNWRSFSESSDDLSPPLDFPLSELAWSSESMIDKSKKIVRFNDNISRNIFRPNSSILGQKRKNQKRSQYKKRSVTRKRSSGSESDPTSSEVGDSCEGCSSMSESELGIEDIEAPWPSLSPISEKSTSPSESAKKSRADEIQSETFDFRTCSQNSKDGRRNLETLDFRTTKSVCDSNTGSPDRDLMPSQTSKAPDNAKVLDFRTKNSDSTSASREESKESIAPSLPQDSAVVNDLKILVTDSATAPISIPSNTNEKRRMDFRTSKKYPKKEFFLASPDDALRKNSGNARKQKKSRHSKRSSDHDGGPQCPEEDNSSPTENVSSVSSEDGWKEVKQKKTKGRVSHKPSLTRNRNQEYYSEDNMPMEEPDIEFSNVMFELD